MPGMFSTFQVEMSLLVKQQALLLLCSMSLVFSMHYRLRLQHCAESHTDTHKHCPDESQHLQLLLQTLSVLSVLLCLCCRRQCMCMSEPARHVKVQALYRPAPEAGGEPRLMSALDVRD